MKLQMYRDVGISDVQSLTGQSPRDVQGVEKLHVTSTIVGFTDIMWQFVVFVSINTIII
ncbi:hypothetical protein WN55_06618 [Dufourea novaeangliae]|uniref:Uncharacterized protein n=1 Tax=Dufourea novaeangliae TaxID=178035 RepID=A0A154PQN2_DUFNO|nr:hypothetical protein WN55_06618 [Dufourea novaeangliae]